MREGLSVWVWVWVISRGLYVWVMSLHHGADPLGLGLGDGPDLEEPL